MDRELTRREEALFRAVLSEVRHTADCHADLGHDWHREFCAALDRWADAHGLPRIRPWERKALRSGV